MKYLRQYIRQVLLTEGMNTHDMLPENIGIKVTESQGRYKTIHIVYYDLGTRIEHKRKHQASKEGIYGSILISPLYPYEPDYDYKEIWGGYLEHWPEREEMENLTCNGAYQVLSAQAAEGWGPLLYDVAIEIATLKGTGLLSDRTSVSQEARNVWNIYMYDRSDVKKFQCDDQYNTLTSTSEDNVDMEIPGAEDYLYDEEYILSNPLSKRYSKEPTVLTAMKNNHKLIQDKYTPHKKTLH
tara:strand:- start:225 stop:944 length:720 start_codon:yes stop_codon:yes gene_type:complete